MIKKWKKWKISSSFWRFPGSEWESATLSPNFHFFSFATSFFFIYSRKFSFFLSFFCHFFFIFLARGTWIPGKPWKTMENHQKQRKMKKKWSCKWKKNENLDSKLQILTLNQEIFKNSRKFSFFSFFFHFPCPWHLKSRKAMKNNEKQWKTIKNKGKWKKNEVANEKKMKIWTQSCRFSLRTRKSSKTRGNFHFFIFFSFFSFFFHFPCPWHLKSRKAMKNNEKQWKTIKNKGKWKKMKLQMKKKMKLQMKKHEVANEKKWSLMAKGDEQKWKKWR